MRRYLVLLCLLIGACEASQSKLLPLEEFEGLYEYENDTTLIIVAGPERKLLYADIGGSRYPLRPHRTDVYLNSGDVEVQFVRDEKNDVIGYRQGQSDDISDQRVFRRLDASVRLPASIWIAKPDGAGSPYKYKAPRKLADGLEVSSLPEGSELANKLSALTNAVFDETYPGIHSILLFHHEALVFEEYFYDQGAETPHQLRSATKTLVAILVGIAIDQGLISSIDEPVLPYFLEYADLKHVDDRKRAITIGDLLTMRSGLDCNDWDSDSPGNESKMVYADDWARFGLDLPMANDPGVVGAYCSANVILLGRIIEKTSDHPLLEFANETLFDPLGFGPHEWDFRPDRSNINNFTQAWLRSRDLMKIGILIAADGAWDDQQIVSSDWMRALKTEQSAIGDTPYGYFYWRRFLNLSGQRVEVPQMSGNGGQKVISLNEGRTILVLTGGNFNQQTETNELIAEFILPGIAE